MDVTIFPLEDFVLLLLPRREWPHFELKKIWKTYPSHPKSHYISYRIARGEQGVLTYEPYKSYLLPHWRFRTASVARTSSQALWGKFVEFYEHDDFVGMDMTRKFIQMGMTRAKRYANYRGGRKYADGKEKGNAVEKSRVHEGKQDKEEASRIFSDVWERCRAHEGYQELKTDFLKEQKEWLEIKREQEFRVDDQDREVSQIDRTPSKKVKIEND